MRLTDNDKRFGPLTWGHGSKGVFSLYYSSGGGGEEFPHNAIYLWVFGLVFRLRVPRLLDPHRSWVPVDYPDVNKGGYWDVNAKEYGFRISGDMYTIYHGVQTFDSRTTQSVHGTIPFLTWRFHRFSIFDQQGVEVYKEDGRSSRIGSYPEQRKIEEANSARALVRDYDGAEITVTYFISEREWRFGDKAFKWLSLFRRPLVRRVLEMSFDKELGRDKGSWKGGITGTSIEMLKGEAPGGALKRFCEIEVRSKNGPSRVEFIVHLAPEDRSNDYVES